MRRILAFLIANRLFILFIGLEILALGMVVNFYGYHRASYFNNANAIGSSIHQKQTQISNYFNLQEVNNDLLAQNAALLSKKIDSTALISDNNDWNRNLNLYGFDVIPAKIIYNTVNRPTNTFVINKGKKHGVKNGLGVASAKGVMGKVIKTHQNYALCLSILNTKSIIVMPKIAELEEKSGSIIWGGINPKKIQLNGVHKFEKVEKGFHVVTSGYSQNFPENIPVGIISSVKPTSGSYFNIIVDLKANLTKDKQVYLFKNNNRNQIDSLINDPINNTF